jgi:putative PIG3 family NAD(P)H quinone oxidoreductase
MIAIEIEGGKGPASALRPAQIDTPSPAKGEILVRVRAAGVNRPDLLQRMGLYPPPPGAPATLGLEIAGEVAALGEGVDQWKPGDRVAALVGGGGYAQYAVVDARHALAIPKGLDFVQAAALPETLFTVFANVFEIGALKAGETLLVHGATSGIGVAAIQMGKAAGATVIATARGAAKAKAALDLGADHAIDAKDEDFSEAVRALGGCDVSLDMVGGDYATRGLDCLKPGGRLVFIAFQGGAKAEFDIAKIMTRRLTVTGSTLRPRSADEKARLTAALRETVWPWVASGKVRAIVDQTLPLARASDAHAALEDGQHLGKIVLEA